MIAPIACTTGHLDQAAKPGTLADPPRWQLRSMRMSVAAPSGRPVPAVAEAVYRETHAASALDRLLGRRLAGDKPFEELVAFDPVFV